MASSTNSLTLEEFHCRYANESGYEYWFGEAIRKSVPTWLHALLQMILGEVFTRAGYAAGSELDLRIDPEWEPRPDVVASLEIEEPYPTKPVDVVAEILSPDDQMDRVHEKCRNYARIGIRQIFVFDPKRELAWEWVVVRETLETVDVLQLGNGEVIQMTTIWKELDRRRQRTRRESESSNE